MLSDPYFKLLQRVALSFCAGTAFECLRHWLSTVRAGVTSRSDEEKCEMVIRSRREFMRETVRSATALGAMNVLSRFGHMNALAAPAPGYQALVCIFLAGGNDGHNTVIPLSTVQQSYSLYAQGRQGLALPYGSLLPIANGSDMYGMHPSMPEMQALYKQGSMAILANVGNLVQPINRDGYNTNNLAIVPGQLFSHSDQTNQWQSAIPNGIASNGWGGRIADLMQAQNAGAVFPPITNNAGCGLFCNGRQTFPATVPPPNSGSQGATGMATITGVQNASAPTAGMQQLLSFDNGLQLVQAGNGILTRGNNYATTLTGLLQSSQITTAFPVGNPLAAQLKTVANVMAVRGELGLTRQIFFCEFGSFDTHGQQLETQAMLLQQLSQAVAAFYDATQELGIAQSVTTFTASEFGRTLNPSGNDGSDHAWGNHHFILGGGVKGGQVFGAFPSLVLGSENDANSRGTLIPTTSIAQYGATLAQWFGVSAANLPSVFPNIGNFATSNLGFMA
jgi:uncharacterized protein (DUF1501 family)